MLRRLVYLLLASTAFCIAITFVLGFFSDILPLASTEEPQSIWRFETAFVLTAVQWIALCVAALSAISITILLWKNAGRSRHP
jgi:hypothetical protein